MLNEASGTANPLPINWQTQLDLDVDDPLFAPVGPNGLIVGGTTGEYYAQTKQERVVLMKLAKETIKDRLQRIWNPRVRSTRNE